VIKAVTSVDNQLIESSPHGFVHVMVTNIAREEVVLPKTTVFALEEEFSEVLVAAINTQIPL
jgi:hypothetical protein